MKIAFAAALLLSGATTATSAQAAETINVSFLAPTGGVSTGLYSGLVNVTVKGTGQSLGSIFNDAFYLLPSGVNDASFYQLTFGTSPLLPVTPSQNAKNFIVGGLPVFNPSNTYSFQLNTGAVVPTLLYFGVGDGNFGDNSGSFEVTVDSAVPEPATWVMMLLGFGAIGFVMRRRQNVSVSYA